LFDRKSNKNVAVSVNTAVDSSAQVEAPTVRTVQDYIDETPVWRDGTGVASTPMTPMQWWIWLLATAGKFFEGLVVFMTGVALPLIVSEFGLSAAEKGVVGAATLAGILFGASALGGLADTFGRKHMFIVEMIIFVVFLTALSLSPSYPLLVVFLFGMGLALGCDYPTAHLMISESIPSRSRGRLILSAFGFQAVGALAGTAIGYLILANLQDVTAWRWMYATAIIPAILVIIGRFTITGSSHWLLERGRTEKAESELQRLLQRRPKYPHKIRLSTPSAAHQSAPRQGVLSGYRELFRGRNRRATILAAMPWFLQDLGTYGIGIFTPTILAAALGHQTANAPNIATIIQNDILAAKGAALIDILLLIGIIATVVLVDRVGRIRLQVIGFIGCAIGLALAAFSQSFSGPVQMTLLVMGFMLFNFMTNMGPNAQTYLIAGEVFPTRLRGRGAGFAASFAKIGAVTTAFLFPVLLAQIGTQTLLMILVGTSLLGALITAWFQIETTGKNLEEIEG
jgi:MFS family permease